MARNLILTGSANTFPKGSDWGLAASVPNAFRRACVQQIATPATAGSQ
ncbi:MAG: hypothetical protein MUD08_10870 [Cytophagales bacterium]|nr:hypothetical protein [Cytophagales bacterium]